MSDLEAHNTGFKFPPEARLRRGGDFDRVYARRCTMRNDALRLFAAPNAADRPRLGLSVSRKVGNAVIRNRWKRAIREAFRLQPDALPVVDLIVQPLVAEPPPLPALKSELVRLARKLASRLTTESDKKPSGRPAGQSATDAGKADA